MAAVEAAVCKPYVWQLWYLCQQRYALSFTMPVDPPLEGLTFAAERQVNRESAADSLEQWLAKADNDRF